MLFIFTLTRNKFFYITNKNKRGKSIVHYIIEIGIIIYFLGNFQYLYNIFKIRIINYTDFQLYQITMCSKSIICHSSKYIV